MKHPTSPCCRYHSQHPAHWCCESCRLPLCHLQTLCGTTAHGGPLPALRTSHAGTTQRARSRRTGPGPDETGHQPAALFVAAIAFPVGLLGFESPAGLLLAVPMAILLLFLMVTLARRAGEGMTDPPSIRELVEVDQIEYGLRLLTFGLPFAALLLITMAATSMTTTTLAWLIAAAVLPAALMTAIVHESPRAAFNPALLIQVAGVAPRAGELRRLVEHRFPDRAKKWLSKWQLRKAKAGVDATRSASAAAHG